MTTGAKDPASLRALWDALSEGVLGLDAQRRVWLCNAAMTPLINRPADGAEGHALWEILRHHEMGEMVDRVLASGAGETRELLFSGPEESSYRVAARPLPPPAGGLLLTFFDVTHLRRLENTRREFVANVSHELKTPLTALRAALETLLDGALEDKSHARGFLETAQEQVERLQRLIEDVLVLSRLERTEKQPAGAASSSLAATAKRVAAALRPTAEKHGVEIRVDGGSDMALPLSEEELTQVLMNLIDNGVKFNRRGGRVRMDWDAEKRPGEFFVEDTGEGIPTEHQGRVFERFYRVDKARSSDKGGTGLGLAIAKHIVENRGGSIRLKSAPGEGSVFTVRLAADKK